MVDELKLLKSYKTQLCKTDPIGVFDSGIGGLNVLKRAVKTLPNERFIYFGDNENAPYGNKSESQLIDLAQNAANVLLKRNVKAIVVACNTVSSCVFEMLKSTSPVPIIPTLPPIIKNKTKRTLLMCTPNTAKSEFVIKNYAFAQVLPLPFLASEIEQYIHLNYHALDTLKGYCIEDSPRNLTSHIQDDKVSTSYGFKRKVANKILLRQIKKTAFEKINLYKDLRGAYGIYDIVVLGCTHYSFLIKQISSYFPSAKIISGEQNAVHSLKQELNKLSLLRSHDKNNGVEFIGKSATKNERMFNYVQN